MDNRLLYSPALYKQKLSEYTAYTVDVITPVGVFRQKANKQEDVIVVDDHTGRFRIYMSYQPLSRLAVNYGLRNPDMKKDFFQWSPLRR